MTESSKVINLPELQICTAFDEKQMRFIFNVENTEEN
jgi:hypothetical protein